MKKNLIVLLIALFSLTILFTSCDSLWNVGAKTDVLFNVNLEKYLTSNTSARSIGVAPGNGLLGDDDNTYTVEVSLRRTSDDRAIYSETMSLQEAQNTNVTFNHVPLGKKVYAQIVVIQNDDDDDNPEEAIPDVAKLPFIFRARSLDTALNGDMNTLVARPNALFFDGTGIGYFGIEIDTGAAGPEYLIPGADYPSNNSDTDYRLFEDVLQEAYDYMKIESEVLPDATVYVKETMIINLPYFSDIKDTWNFPGLNLVRANENGHMVSFEGGGGRLVLKNITIDGNGEYFNANSAALYKGGEGAIEMHSGVTIKNNNNMSSFGGGIYLNASGEFTMYGGTITGNHASRGGGIDINTGNVFLFGGVISGNTAAVHEDSISSGGGAGVFLTPGDGGGVLHLKGSLIVKDNIADDGTQNNIFIVTPFTVDGELTSSKGSIGITIFTYASESFGTFASSYESYDSSYDINTDDADAFFSDNPVYSVNYRSDVYMVDPYLELVQK